MKKLASIVLLMILNNTGYAQIIKRASINTTGYATPNMKFSVGQYMAANYSVGSNMITLGFQQPVNALVGTDSIADIDGDSILNSIDMDDDNDGVLDLEEDYPACKTATSFNWVNWTTIGANSATGTISNGVKTINVNVTHSFVGIIQTNGMYNSSVFPSKYNIATSANSIANAEAGIIKVTFSEPISYPTIALSSIGNESNSVPVITSMPYNVEWNGSGVTFNSATQFSGMEGNTVLSLNGRSDSFSINFMKWENYCSINFGIKDISKCSGSPLDSDGDGNINSLDTDSDGDGCNDAVESGILQFGQNLPVAGPYGANGFADSLETFSESGVFKNNYTYQERAINASINTACKDSDGDGFPDVNVVASNDTTICKGSSLTLKAKSLPKTYTVGDVGPAGGYIFYDKKNNTDGWRYLEVAPIDQASESIWGCYDINIPTSTNLFTGFDNTSLILNSCSNAKAAKICDSANINGYDDWYLPSRAELKMVYDSLFNKLKLGGFTLEDGNYNPAKRYWTSSQVSAPNAWAIDFNGFYEQIQSKNETATRVRAIRRFSDSLSLGYTAYKWSTGDTSATINVNPDTTTTYYVEITNGTIKTKDTITVVVAESFDAKKLSETTWVYNNDFATLNLGSGFAKYKWNTGDTVQSITVNKSDKYFVELLGRDGCVYRDSTIVNFVNAKILQNDTILCPSDRILLNAKKYDRNVRYIKFESTYSQDNGQVNVYEIKAYKNGVNIALGKKTFANSPSSLFNSSNAVVDGNENTRWSSNRNDPGPDSSNPHYIIVDLLEDLMIDSIYLNIKGFDSWKQTFTVKTSSDSVSWEKIGEAVNSTGIFTYYPDKSSADIKYLWSTGDTTSSIIVEPKTTTSYQLNVSANGYTSLDTIQISIYNKEIYNVFADTIHQIADSIELNAGESYADYLWNNKLTTSKQWIYNSGEYSVKVKDKNGCYANDTVFVSLVNGVIEQKDTTIQKGDSLKLSIGKNKLGVTSNSYFTNAMLNSLVGWYPFNGNANDESKWGAHGKVNNAALTSDRFGKSASAYLFNGVDAHILIDDTLKVTNRFTISFWAKPDFSYQEGLVLGDGSINAGGNDFYYGINNNRIVIRADKSGKNLNEYINIGDSSIQNKWINVIWKMSPENSSVYLNGKFLTTINTAGTNAGYHDGKSYIGAAKVWSSGLYNPFKGMIDDIAIFNRDLTDGEIQSLTNITSGNWGIKYKWSTGDTTPTIIVKPNTTKKYYVDITDGVVTKRDSILIAVAGQSLDFNPLKDSISTHADSLVLDAGHGYTSYKWSNGATTQTIKISTNGSYQVMVADSLGRTASDTTFVYFIKYQIEQNDTTICKGVELKLSANQANYKQYMNIANWYAVDTEGKYFYPSYELPNREWVYVAITRGANNEANLYINGELLNAAKYQNNTYNFNRIDLGAVFYTSYHSFFKGWIDELKVSNIVQPASYFANNFKNNNPLTADIYTIGLWHFDESSGTSTLASKGVNGNLTNAVFKEGKFGNAVYFNGLNAFASIKQSTPTKNITYEYWIKPDSILASSPLSLYGMNTSGQGIVLSNPKLKYTWSTGDTTESINVKPTTTTTYYLTIFDGLKTTKDSVKITVDNSAGCMNKNMLGYIVQNDTAVCKGKVIQLQAAGAISDTALFLNYHWSTGDTTKNIVVSPTKTTKYFLTTTDGISSSIDSVTITITENKTFNPLQDTLRICGDSVILNAGNGFKSYRWNTTSLQKSIVAKQSGQYNIDVVDSLGCLATDSSYVSIIKADILQKDTLVCKGTSINLNGWVNSSYVSNLYDTSYYKNLRAGSWELKYTYNNKTYWLHNQLKNWKDAKQLCEQWGGTMYCPNTLEENNAVSIPITNLFQNADVWIGLYQDTLDINFKEPIGGWKWLDQSTVNYTNWKSSEPNNLGGAENYGILDFNNAGSTWNDLSFNYNARVLMEYTPLVSKIKYKWSTGDTTSDITVNPVKNSIYYLTVSDGITSCTDSIKINIKDYPTYNPLQDTLRVCGDSVLLNAGSGFKSYTWNNMSASNSVIVKQSGLYKVIAADSLGCLVSDSSYVSIVKADILQKDTMVCKGTQVVLNTYDMSFGIASNISQLPVNLKSGLLAWYPFNGNTNDESGNNRHGTIIGNSKFVPNINNIPNKAFDFDGATKIQIPHNTAFNAFPLTISAWIKTSDANPGHIINKYENASWNGWTMSVEPKGVGSYLRSRNDAMISQYDNYPEFETIDSLNNGKWHNLVFVVDSTSGRLYHDGKLEDTQLWRGRPGIAQNSWPLYVGYYPNTYASIGSADPYFDGIVDDVGLWNRALNAAEIQSLFKSNTAPILRYRWSTSDTTQNITVSPAKTTKYFLTITDGVSTCTDSVTITVTENKTFNPLQDTLRICGDSVMLNGGNGFKSYRWNTTSLQKSIVAKQSGQYKIDVIDSLGCLANDSSYVSIVKADILQKDTLVCKGTLIKLSGWVNPLATKIKYKWSTGDTTANIMVTPTKNATYYLTVSDGFTSCTDSVKINIKDYPTYNPLQDTLRVCGDSVLLNAGNGFKSYTWNNMSAPNSVIAKQSGLYKVIAADSLGCLASDSSYVSIVKADILQKDTMVCKGAPVVLHTYNMSVGSASSITQLPVNLRNGLLAWYPLDGNALDASGKGLNGIVTNAIATTDRFGKLNSAFRFDSGKVINIPNTQSFNTFPLTVSFWIKPDTLKGNNNGNIFGKYSPALWNGYQIMSEKYIDVKGNQKTTIVPWYIRDYSNRVLGDYGDSSFYARVDMNTWTHGVFVMDSTGGKLYINGELYDKQPWKGKLGSTSNGLNWKIGGKYDDWYRGLIDELFIFNRPLSSSEVRQLFNPIKKYKWSTGETTASITVFPTKTTTYYVTVSDGITICTDSVTITVPFNNAEIVVNKEIQCLKGNNFELSISDTTLIGGSKFKWDFGTASNTTKMKHTINYNSVGMYNVKLVVKNIYGCSDTLQKRLTVIENPASPLIKAIGDTVICIGNSVQLTSNLFSNNQWLRNGVAIKNAKNSSYTAFESGFYQAYSTNYIGCNSDTSKVISVTAFTIPAAPVIAINKAKPILCGGDTLGLISSVLTGNQWYINNVPIAGEVGNVLRISKPGSYSVTSTNKFGCSSKLSTPIAVNQEFTILKPGIIRVENDLISSYAAKYKWYYNNVLLPNDTANLLKLKTNGIYRVATSTNNICWTLSDPFMVQYAPNSTNQLMDLELNAYPNPTTSLFYLQVKLKQRYSGLIQINIVDANGNNRWSYNKYLFNDVFARLPINLNGNKGVFTVKVSVNGYTPKAIQIIGM